MLYSRIGWWYRTGVLMGCSWSPGSAGVVQSQYLLHEKLRSRSVTLVFIQDRLHLTCMTLSPSRSNSPQIAAFPPSLLFRSIVQMSEWYRLYHLTKTFCLGNLRSKLIGDPDRRDRLWGFHAGSVPVFSERKMRSSPLLCILFSL